MKEEKKQQKKLTSIEGRGGRIKLTNLIFEQIIDGQRGGLRPVVGQLLKREFDAEPLYWLTAAFDELLDKSKTYLKTKRELALRFVEKYEADGEEKDKSGKVVRKWKKDDPVTDGLGNFVWEDFDGWLKEFEDLQAISFELSIAPIQLELKGLKSSGEEMRVLRHFIRKPPIAKEETE